MRLAHLLNQVQYAPIRRNQLWLLEKPNLRRRQHRLGPWLESAPLGARR
jgi:hypothetical protein